MSKLPYLQCPWCPSQSFPSGIGKLRILVTQPRNMGQDTNSPIQRYECISKHTFYVEKEINGTKPSISPEQTE